jgi:hypothetical protein
MVTNKESYKLQYNHPSHIAALQQGQLWRWGKTTTRKRKEKVDKGKEEEEGQKGK